MSLFCEEGVVPPRIVAMYMNYIIIYIKQSRAELCSTTYSKDQKKGGQSEVALPRCVVRYFPSWLGHTCHGSALRVVIGPYPSFFGPYSVLLCLSCGSCALSVVVGPYVASWIPSRCHRALRVIVGPYTLSWGSSHHCRALHPLMGPYTLSWGSSHRCQALRVVVGPYTPSWGLTCHHWPLRIVGPYASSLGLSRRHWAFRVIVGPHAASLGLLLGLSHCHWVCRLVVCLPSRGLGVLAWFTCWHWEKGWSVGERDGPFLWRTTWASHFMGPPSCLPPSDSSYSSLSPHFPSLSVIVKGPHPS